RGEREARGGRGRVAPLRGATRDRRRRRLVVDELGTDLERLPDLEGAERVRGGVGGRVLAVAVHRVREAADAPHREPPALVVVVSGRHAAEEVDDPAPAVVTRAYRALGAGRGRVRRLAVHDPEAGVEVRDV